jgi:hypothetical protein
VDLGVRTAGPLVRAAPHDNALTIDDHRPDHRVRTRPAAAALGKVEGEAH